MVKEANVLSAKDKLLKYLIEHKTPQSIMKVSGAVAIDYKNTYNIVHALKSNIIFQKKIGNTNLISINFLPHQDILTVERKRTAQFLIKNKDFELIQQDILSLNYPFVIVLLFGSYVKKTQTENSDIDLCIICDNAKIKEKLKSKLDLLPVKLENHDFNTDEFEQMLKTKEENVGKEIVKNNIILYGYENYYNLISKWMKKE